MLASAWWLSSIRKLSIFSTRLCLPGLHCLCGVVRLSLVAFLFPSDYLHGVWLYFESCLISGWSCFVQTAAVYSMWHNREQCMPTIQCLGVCHVVFYRPYWNAFFCLAYFRFYVVVKLWVWLDNDSQVFRFLHGVKSQFRKCIVRWRWSTSPIKGRD